MPSVKDGTAQGTNISKKSPVTLQSVSAPKAKVMPSVVPLKKVCENRTVCPNKAPPHKGAVLSPSSGIGSLPREKHTSVKKSTASWASSGKLLTKSKVPVKRSALERTPSISSVSSTQTAGATVVIKNGERPSKPVCQNGTSGSVPLKAVPRPRLHSLKSSPKGTRARSASLNQCTPKSSGPVQLARKANEGRGNQLLGAPGKNRHQSLSCLGSALRICSLCQSVFPVKHKETLTVTKKGMVMKLGCSFCCLATVRTPGAGFYLPEKSSDDVSAHSNFLVFSRELAV
ncbi:microtubule-associated tumor suppressor 1 homolog [Phaenicophaeus curvirostris]|uniref:microtubule-associated tumor suppressor 1 homolog n=1 Tax=Phaenicophaeus curvirostris TaxID=33595 RepID=UPI0037F0F9C9